MAKPILIFDWDRTLFDTPGHFDFHIAQSVQEMFGIPETILTDIKMVSYKFPDKRVGFLPELYIEKIAKHLGKEVEEIKDTVLNIMEEKTAMGEYVYEDAVPTLEKLSDKYTLGIFSEGEKWQNTKIDLSGIKYLFDYNHIYVFTTKASPENLAKIPIPSIIVDDKLSVLEEINNLYPQPETFRLIWLDRKNETTISTDLEKISSLVELPQLLE